MDYDKLKALRDSIHGDCYKGQAWEKQTIDELLADRTQSAQAVAEPAVDPVTTGDTHRTAVEHAQELLKRLGYHRDGDHFVNVNRAGAEAMHVSTIATIVHAALLTAPAPAPNALDAETVKDAERLRGLHWATTLIETSAGGAYEEALQTAVDEMLDAVGNDHAKTTLDQYRRVLDCGLDAARAAIAAQSAQGGV
ncbi:hypothetical protein G7048_19110 [Diaphorobacter sp. HDW4B]|uniref:hypothetical protein n=1 Tax=Diaphorobacter sp. HDW4B TaxID=2714925 RepID=UPI00140BAEBC|nr:hypothetical protein [Diaphorobacter sp. HDW4B]QIL72276.1 hypothetical protein G7048_19110 [Diaphorobacter sp. HDW4B]